MKQWFYPAILATGLAFGSFNAQVKSQADMPVRTDRPRGLDEIISSTYQIKNTITVEAKLYSNTDNNLIAQGGGEFTAYGSCFGIAYTSSGIYFLTAAHLTKTDTVNVELREQGMIREETRQANQKIRIIETNEGVEREVLALEEVARDEENDLSLLFAATQDKRFKIYQRLNPPRQVILGDRLFSIGYPFGSQGSFGKTLYEGVVTNLRNDFEQPTWLITSATLNRGMSGGPTIAVIDGAAYVVGVNSVIVDPQTLEDTYGVAKNIRAFILKQPNGRALLKERL